MAKMRKWRRHTVEFKRQAVERMKSADNIRDLARELGIQQKLLYTWKYQFEGRPEPRHANLSGGVNEYKEKKFHDEIARLKSALADKALETDFLKCALLKVKEALKTGESGEPASTTPSRRGSRSKAVH